MTRPLISKEKQKKIARERVNILLAKAEEKFNSNKGLANRYVTLARTIAMKARIRIPIEDKRKFCKHCYKFLKPGVNSRIRMRDGKVIITCLECKKITRIPIKKQNKKIKSTTPPAKI